MRIAKAFLRSDGIVLFCRQAFIKCARGFLTKEASDLSSSFATPSGPGDFLFLSFFIVFLNFLFCNIFKLFLYLLKVDNWFYLGLALIKVSVNCLQLWYCLSL